MKILYGIQGTGNGHIARARALTPELLKLGIDIDFVFSGRKREDFFNMDIFGDDFRCFEGMTFISEQGRLQKRKTLLKNNIKQVIKDIVNLDLSAYDLIISDFEPITAWASKIRKKPSLGISHQCAFEHEIPKTSGDTIDKLLMRFFAPTQTRIGLHWYHFNQPLLPPLIEPHKNQDVNKKKILVYMGFESVEAVTHFVSAFSDYNFYIYANVPKKIDLGHVQIKPLSHTEFHHDLKSAYGVISNAGFELASECLALGKKLLIKPLLGQYEQASNALALQCMSRATIINKLDQQILAQWLEREDHKPISYPHVAKHLAHWIQQGTFDNVEQLVDSVWSETGLCLDYGR